jgi:hypothetical protein
MPSSTETQSLDLTRCRLACERGVQWCADLQQPDGSIRMKQDCFDSMYKFPAAFAVMGRYVEAGKMLNWLENETLTDAGDFSFPQRKHLFDWFDQFYTYTNSWITIAAQRTGFFRLARRASDYLLRYQNPKTGALQSRPIEKAGNALADTTITAQGGICYLYTGHIDQAIKAADALTHIAEAQKPNDHRFFFRIDDAGNLVTELPDGAPAGQFYVDSHATGQAYFFLGIPAAFLCHAYELTGNHRYLTAARRYVDFAIACPGAMTSFASGKVGYALSLLYRSTSDPHYYNVAANYLDWLVNIQKPDGRWIMDEWTPQQWYFEYDCTAEFVYWVSEMSKHLSAPRR